jgi:hypothetical protein
MSHMTYCDVCKKEITTADNLPYPYLKAEYAETVVVFPISFRNELGWPMDICAECLRGAVKRAEWVDPAEEPIIEAKR